MCLLSGALNQLGLYKLVRSFFVMLLQVVANGFGCKAFALGQKALALLYRWYFTVLPNFHMLSNGCCRPCSGFSLPGLLGACPGAVATNALPFNWAGLAKP